MPLSDMSNEALLTAFGKGAEALAIAVGGAPRLASRLHELGVIPGAQIRILQAGSPTVIQIGQTRLGLRKQEAAAIRVCPIPGSDISG